MDPWPAPAPDPFLDEDYAMTFDDVMASVHHPDTYHADQARNWRGLQLDVAATRLHALAADLADRIAATDTNPRTADQLADRIAHTIATLSLTETHLRNTSREDTP